MNQKINIVLFAYNFPHRKTIDFINKLYEEGFFISLILAADYIKIRSPKSAFSLGKKTKTSPHQIARKHDIPFYVVNHNSEESISLLKKYQINFGIISGSRILKDQIIKKIKYGILNFHPGLLPDIRGLDSVLWSIEKNYPIGVTAHLINNKIDAGKLVCQKKTSIIIGDNIESLYEKNYQLQLYLLPISLNLILNNKKLKTLSMGEYNYKMSYKKQLAVIKKVTQYVNKYAIT